MSFRSFELSHQQLVGYSREDHPEMAFHGPLLELEADAPQLSLLGYRNTGVAFPFSNDECTAPYFNQLQTRTLTPEYQEATHRVAIVVGESALAANLPHIPEETIIVLDKSPDMCIYMQEYAAGLRSSGGPEQWLDRLRAVGPPDIFRFMRYQVSEWADAGYIHPLIDSEAFAVARAQANGKAIVPWCADITSTEDMNNLAQVLRSHGATVTMMNLTNVLPSCSEILQGAAECAALFSSLPLSSQAPILTTTLGPPVYKNLGEEIVGRQEAKGNIQTGPFFGLDNLARARNERDSHPLGALVGRRSVGFENIPDANEDALDLNAVVELVLRALSKHTYGDSDGWL